MKIEENTLEINPINNAKVKLNIVGAPKNSIATTTTITVNTVLIERVIVCLIDLLTISSICSVVVITLTFCKFSRSRTNVTIVSLFD